MDKGLNGQLNREKTVTEEKSLFAFKIIQAALVVLACLAFFGEQKIIGMVALGCAFFGLIGKMWARQSAKHLSVRIDAEKCYMFPGDKSNIELEIRNDKATGVSFVEMSKEFKTPLVIEPDYYDAEDEQYRIRCSLIKAHQTSNYRIGITARKRGIEDLKTAKTVTGDPFGIAEVNVLADSSSKKELVVYPKIVPVDCSKFTKDLWEGEHNKRGVLDDVSVIKLTRPYQNNDPEKSINWRLMARGQGLITNKYEVISPERMHIFFDGHSFNGRTEGEIIMRPPQRKALENTLSILASLTLELENQGIKLGFSFPETPTLDAVNIKGTDGSSTEVLYRMADFELFDIKFDVVNGQVMKYYKRSQFKAEEILEEVFDYGKCCFVTYDEKAASESELVKGLTDAGVPLEILIYSELKLLKIGGKSND